MMRSWNPPSMSLFGFSAWISISCESTRILMMHHFFTGTSLKRWGFRGAQCKGWPATRTPKVESSTGPPLCSQNHLHYFGRGHSHGPPDHDTTDHLKSHFHPEECPHIWKILKFGGFSRALKNTAGLADRSRAFRRMRQVCAAPKSCRHDWDLRSLQTTQNIAGFTTAILTTCSILTFI